MTDANGQPSRDDLTRAYRDASRRLRTAGTAAYDAADAILTTGPRPGLPEDIYGVGVDLTTLAGDLARLLALTTGQRDNQDQPKEQT